MFRGVFVFVCVLMIKLSPAGLVIILKGTKVPSCQQLGVRLKSPACVVNTKLLPFAVQSERPPLMNHCTVTPSGSAG